MKNEIVLSIIIPVYNEEKNIRLLHERLTIVLSTITDNYEILWVNDRSNDNTLDIIKELVLSHSRNRYISLSRNFGHQKSITAGIDKCKGKAAVIMDGDLQDPPELIPELWKKYIEGYKVVYAKRRVRKGESYFKKSTAAFFYRLMKKTSGVEIPLDTGDFRLINRTIIDHLKQMPEQDKFIRGQIAWIGYDQTFVLYDRQERLEGKTKFGFFKMLHFALDGITAFSNYPLRIVSLTGFAVSILAFIIILYALYSKFIKDEVISGWTSLIISVLFLGGIQLISIGIIGQYISRINSDVRKRPLYIIEEES